MTINPKWLVGKTIASVDMRPFEKSDQASKNDVAHNPIIRFTDGSAIYFVTEETGGSEYGTAICYRKPPPKKVSRKAWLG